VDRCGARILGLVYFVLGTVAMVLLLVGVLFVLEHFYSGNNAELLDWKPTRSPELEVQNEIDDVQQMLEAQNEMRRRRGAAERSEQELRDEVAAEELERLRQRKGFRAI
jgi:hypothetical protein